MSSITHVLREEKAKGAIASDTSGPATPKPSLHSNSPTFLTPDGAGTPAQLIRHLRSEECQLPRTNREAAYVAALEHSAFRFDSVKRETHLPSALIQIAAKCPKDQLIDITEINTTLQEVCITSLATMQDARRVDVMELELQAMRDRLAKAEAELSQVKKKLKSDDKKPSDDMSKKQLAATGLQLLEAQRSANAAKSYAQDLHDKWKAAEERLERIRNDGLDLTVMREIDGYKEDIGRLKRMKAILEKGDIEKDNNLQAALADKNQLETEIKAMKTQVTQAMNDAAGAKQKCEELQAAQERTKLRVRDLEGKVVILTKENREQAEDILDLQAKAKKTKTDMDDLESNARVLADLLTAMEVNWETAKTSLNAVSISMSLISI